MPLLDIAISQPCSCFGNNKLAFSSKIRFRNRFLIGNDRGLGLVSSTFSWQSLSITEKVGKHFTSERGKRWRGRLVIKAVSTLEITSVPHKDEGVKDYENGLRMDLDSARSSSTGFESQSSSEDSTKAVDGHEKLRRMRISKANKGKLPWNKGRKHSPETLQRIKERTRLAMQDPKVRMKLLKLGHGQSDETRAKIGIGVRLGWQKRRERLMLQETCHYEWQNLIAMAARKGLLGEDELQWDSFKILSEQLEAEWLEGVEQRRTSPRPRGNKRAPKSAEQKRKIAAAIAAKWADPDYRNRVCGGLAQFHASQGVVRKPRKKPSGDGEPRKRSPKKVKIDDLAKRETKSPIQRFRSRWKTPSYTDPLASSKLEMLRSIRAQRAVAAMDQKSVAVYRAKLLIAEAQKAAEALETAANKNALAQASLIESKLLIAEANQIIESIENKEPTPLANIDDNSDNSTEPVPNIKNETNPDGQNQGIAQHRKVNGVNSITQSGNFSINNFVLSSFANGNASVETDEKLHQMSSNGVLPDFRPNTNGSPVEGLERKLESFEGLKKQGNVTKKWVRGRLVEVADDNVA